MKTAVRRGKVVSKTDLHSKQAAAAMAKMIDAQRLARFYEGLPVSLAGNSKIVQATQQVMAGFLATRNPANMSVREAIEIAHIMNVATGHAIAGHEVMHKTAGVDAKNIAGDDSGQAIDGKIYPVQMSVAKIQARLNGSRQ